MILSHTLTVECPDEYCFIGFTTSDSTKASSSIPLPVCPDVLVQQFCHNNLGAVNGHLNNMLKTCQKHSLKSFLNCSCLYTGICN